MKLNLPLKKLTLEDLWATTWTEDSTEVIGEYNGQPIQKNLWTVCCEVGEKWEMSSTIHSCNLREGWAKFRCYENMKGSLPPSQWKPMKIKGEDVFEKRDFFETISIMGQDGREILTMNYRTSSEHKPGKGFSSGQRANAKRNDRKN